MAVFKLNVPKTALLDNYAECREALKTLIGHGPAESTLGICYNLSHMSNVDGYELVKLFFDTLTGADECNPFKTFPWDDWDTRMLWLEAMLQAYRLEDVYVTTEMLNVMCSPIRQELFA